MLSILKNQINGLNIVILKKIHTLQNVLFFIKNLFQGNFLHCLRFFMLSKNLNKMPALLLKTKCVALKSFSSRFSHLDEYCVFLSHLKSFSLMMIRSEQRRIAIPVLLFRININKLFCVTADIQLPKFRIKAVTSKANPNICPKGFPLIHYFNCLFKYTQIADF